MESYGHRQLRRCKPWRRFAASLAGVAIVAGLALAGGEAALAATFSPINGTLTVRAGTKPQQSAPAALGVVTLSDSAFPVAFDFATASLQTSIANNRQFNFAATASSVTSSVAPPGQTRAAASVVFSQTMVIATPQWLQLSAQVLSPAGDPDVTSFVSFGRTGQAPLHILSDTGGGDTTREGFFAAGSYTVTVIVNTQAALPPSHAGAASGQLLAADLADFNGNGVVDAADLATLTAGIGATPATFATGDSDADADVDGADFLIWQRQLGTNSGAPASTAANVPEPASALLIAAAIAAWRPRRRS
jgi:hypothetical protein